MDSNPFAQFNTPAEPTKGENPFAQFRPPAEGDDEEGPGFLERSSMTISEGLESAGNQLTETPISGLLPGAQLQAAGADLIPMVSDVMVDGGISLAKTILPDEWQDNIVDFSRKTWEQISSNPVAKEMLDAAKVGLEEYNELAKKYPGVARRLEAAVNIAGLRVAPKGSPKLTEAAKAVERRAAKTLKNNRIAQVGQAMEPIGKKSTQGGKIAVEGKGPFKKKVYKPSEFETGVHREVAKVKEFDPKGLFHTERMNVLRDKAGSYKVELDDFITKKGNPVINKQKLKAGLANKINNLDDTSSLVGDARTHAIKMFRKMDELIEASDGTAAGILQARRDFDKWIRETKPKGFDTQYFNAYGWAMRPIREGVNDAVHKATGSTRVKTLLDKQHKLLAGADMIEPKAYIEADGAVHRMFEILEEGVGTKMPTTPIAQAEVARRAVSPIGVAIGGTGLGILQAYKGLKWIATAPGQRWMAQVAQLATSNPLIMPHYNALVQASQGIRPEEGEE